jgi:hypothetical protein
MLQGGRVMPGAVRVVANAALTGPARMLFCDWSYRPLPSVVVVFAMP